MSETHFTHTKPLSRIQSLSEPRGGSKVAKPVFSNSAKRLRSFSLSRNKNKIGSGRSQENEML